MQESATWCARLDRPALECDPNLFDRLTWPSEVAGIRYGYMCVVENNQDSIFFVPIYPDYKNLWLLKYVNTDQYGHVHVNYEN